jgi:cysteinyl-tRNA synthetase
MEAARRSLKRIDKAVAALNVGEVGAVPISGPEKEPGGSSGAVQDSSRCRDCHPPAAGLGTSAVERKGGDSGGDGSGGFSHAKRGAVRAAAAAADGALVLEAEASQRRFEEAMCDDLNTPLACAALFELVGSVERRLALARSFRLPDSEGATAVEVAPQEVVKECAIGLRAAQSVLRVVRAMDSVFGVLYEVPNASIYIRDNEETSKKSTVASSLGVHPVDASLVPPHVAELLARRAVCKGKKQYAEADRLRNELLELGFCIKDLPSGGLELETR